MSLIPLGFWAASGGGGAGGPAYDLLETTTLASSAASVTFSGLDAYSDYKHLQIRWVARSNRPTYNLDVINMTFNSDSSTSYRYKKLAGDGSSVTSFSEVLTTSSRIAEIPTASQPVSAFGSGIIEILDFSSNNKNTTSRIMSGRTDSPNRIGLWSSLYVNTNPITYVQLTVLSNLIAGSRFSLYGVK